MSGPRRAVVKAVFPLGPWMPGLALPVLLGAVGVAASLLVLRDVPLVVGLLLTAGTTVRVRSPAPWLLVADLALGQLLRDPALLDAELPAAVLLVHALAVLVLLARVVPVRSRVQLAALAPAARSFVLVQLPAQALAVLLLLAEGRLRSVAVAPLIGGVLLVATAVLLLASRRAARED